MLIFLIATNYMHHYQSPSFENADIHIMKQHELNTACCYESIIHCSDLLRTQQRRTFELFSILLKDETATATFGCVLFYFSC